MTTMLDVTDVPPVPATQLASVMRFMIDSGRGLVLLNGLPAAGMRELETVLWHRLEGDVAHRRAVLVRFECLVAVFSARRLRAMLLKRGFPLIAPAIELAARMRLNAGWGFNPHKFNLALHALAQAPVSAERPAATPADQFDLAA